MPADDESVADHTIRLLQELRSQIQEFRSDMLGRYDELGNRFEREIQGLHTGLGELRADMERNFSVTNGLLSGEMATRNFAMKGVEERFQAHERRLTALEARSRPVSG